MRMKLCTLVSGARNFNLRVFLLLTLGLFLLLVLGHNSQLRTRAANKISSLVQESNEWDRYTIRYERFSVLLPMAPAMTTYQVHMTTYSQSPVLNEIGVYSEGVVYAIRIFRQKESLENFISRSRLASGSFKRELSLPGIRGKEYVFEDEARKGITQFFLFGERIYVFSAIGSRLGTPDVGMPRFFDSIKFERLSAGLAIVNGSGDPPSINATAVDGSAPRAFTLKEITTKAVVSVKPQPIYTDAARQNQVIGTVVLRGVFTSSGAVTNIAVVSGLPDGLTENAIAAARQIRFIPAVKDGRFVNMYIQLEYNFNLY